MQATYSVPNFTPIQQRYIAIVGFSTVLLAGVVACAALIFLILWAIVQLALLLLQGTIATLGAIGTTFTSSSPDIRLVVLALAAFGLYRLFHQAARKRGQS